MAAKDGRDLDDPPNSRLFILCQKGTTEQEFRDAFGKYGNIEDVWIIKDKRTNEDRGKDSGLSTSEANFSHVICSRRISTSTMFRTYA